MLVGSGNFSLIAMPVMAGSEHIAERGGVTSKGGDAWQVRSGWGETR